MKIQQQGIHIRLSKYLFDILLNYFLKYVFFLLNRIQFNSEEQWTKALKFLLTNLKWGLAWVSSQFTEEKVELPSI